MNKKIYFNHKFIELVSNNDQYSQDQSVKIYEDNNGENLNEITDTFLVENNNYSVKIISKNVDETFNRLKKIFYYIEAAGGFIEKQQEFLFIYRHGKWDLPKGKLEKNENIKDAAIRECEEECGIKNLKILRPMSSTFHLYPYKKNHALKQTFWFYMQSDYNGPLKPQLEEDIHEARWFNKKDILSTIIKNTYYTIHDITMEGLVKTI